MAKALTKCYLLFEKDNIALGISWDKSLFQRMGFVRCKTTTVTIPIGPQKEAELKFMHKIVTQIDKYQIPPSLVISFDQTFSKYIQAS